MCGRYASARSVDDITGAFGIASNDVDDTLPDADWNVAPTKQVPAVVARDGRPALTSLRWGLVPSWAANPSDGATQSAATLFNARIETGKSADGIVSIGAPRLVRVEVRWQL